MDNIIKDRITTLLQRIEEREQKFGDSIYNSHTDPEHFLKWGRECFPNLEADFSVYLFLTSLVDGLNFNGLYIYGTTPNADYNIYDNNLDWWDVEYQKRYLFFADDSISWFCLEADSGIYYVLDKPSGSKMEQFETLGELLVRALETSLL